MDSKKNDITLEFAEYVYGFNKLGIEDDIIDLAKLSFMDWVAAAVSGSREELAGKLYKLAETAGGSNQSTLIGAGRKNSAFTAALVNGSLAHAQDFDDVHVRLQLHLTGSVVAASFALCQYMGYGGETMLKAIIAGMQVMSALGAGVLPQHHQQKWHSTGTLGAFGSAAAAAVVLKLSPVQICNAFGIASTYAAGIHANFGTMSKPLQSGNAAKGGLTAAFLAGENFTGAGNVLDRGYLEIVSPVVYKDKILEALYGHFAVKDIRFKRFPCGAPNHAAILSSFKIRQSKEIKPDEIEKVVVRVYPRAVNLAGNPSPENGLEAKFSIPYCTLTALLKGEVGLEAFTDEGVKDKEVRRLLPKLILEPEPEFDSTRGASVEVFFKGGRVVRESSPLFLDEIDGDKQKQEVLSKFRTLARKYGITGEYEQLESLILHMEDLEDVNIIGEKL